MFSGHQPIYIQIAEQVRREILSGALNDGDQVKSTTQYATDYRINPATAAKAFALLVDEGLIHKQRGLGMFVSPGAADKLRGIHRSQFLEDIIKPALHEAAMLGINQQQIVDYMKSSWPVPRANEPYTTGPTQGGQS